MKEWCWFKVKVEKKSAFTNIKPCRFIVAFHVKKEAICQSFNRLGNFLVQTTTL